MYLGVLKESRKLNFFMKNGTNIFSVGRNTMGKLEAVSLAVIAVSVICTAAALLTGEQKHVWETKLRWLNPRMEKLSFSF